MRELKLHTKPVPVVEIKATALFIHQCSKDADVDKTALLQKVYQKLGLNPIAKNKIKEEIKVLYKRAIAMGMVWVSHDDKKIMASIPLTQFINNTITYDDFLAAIKKEDNNRIKKDKESFWFYVKIAVHKLLDA